MRLFFKDPAENKLAIDTERREYFTAEAGDVSAIDNSPHQFIKVSSAADLETILKEIDFNAWDFSDIWLI